MGRTLPLVTLGLGAMLLAWVVFLRPISLGGPASYAVVSGTSMEPTLDLGDLVLTRKQAAYTAGDVVVFRVPEGEPGAGGTVIHRIVGGSAEEGFLLQGDHNQGLDPWRPEVEDILGRMWFRVPGGGRVIAFVGQPLVLACVAGGLGVFGVLSGGSANGAAGGDTSCSALTAASGPKSDHSSRRKNRRRSE
jgi:signal peptidase